MSSLNDDYSSNTSFSQHRRLLSKDIGVRNKPSTSQQATRQDNERSPLLANYRTDNNIHEHGSSLMSGNSAAVNRVDGIPIQSNSDTAGFEGQTKLYAVYVLGILCIIYIMNQFDRQILAYTKSLVAGPIADGGLELTNGQYGLLYGYGFSLMYVICGMSVGILSDKTSRKLLLLLGLVIWSIMTSISGIAKNYYAFLFARLGLGVGQAACNPPAFALIGDYFPPEYRAVANSVYNFGIYFGSFASSSIGNGVGNTLGWRKLFIGAGITGVGLAVLFMLTVKEPPRGRYGNYPGRRAVKVPEKFTIMETAKYICSLDSAWIISVSAGFRALAGYAFQAFVPNYLFSKYDSHDHPRNVIGTYYGLIVLFGGLAGSLLGGIITKLWSRTNPKAPVLVAALGTLISCPFVLGFIYADKIVGEVDDRSYSLALVFVFLAYISAEVWGGPAASIFQSILPSGMQASGFAWYFVIMTGIGGGGPEIVGVFQTEDNGTTMPYVLSSTIVGSYLISAAGFFMSSFFVDSDKKKKMLFDTTKDMPYLSVIRRNIYIGCLVVLILFTLGLVVISVVDIHDMKGPVVSPVPTHTSLLPTPTPSATAT